MRMGSLLGVIATLLAVGASSSVTAAGPDRPKSLTLATASPGGAYYVYGGCGTTRSANARCQRRMTGVKQTWVKRTD